MPSLSLDTIRIPIAAQVPEGKMIVLKPGEPFSCEVYKVDRNPFTQPHVRTTPVHTHQRGSATTKHDLPNTTVGDSSQYPRLRWDASKNNPKDKPAAVFTTGYLKDFKLDFFSDFAKKAETLTQDVVEKDTPYGRWRFIRANGATVFERFFRPRKAVRKFYLRHWKVGKKGWPQFPVPLTGGVTEYDTKMHYEDLIFAHRSSTNVIFNAQGIVCPWCGAWQARNEAYKLEYRCPACNILSVPYENWRGK
jgi:hypothetical protein